MKNLIRHIAGYTFGFTVFFLLIPFGLYQLSQTGWLFQDVIVFKSDLIRILLSLLIFIVGAVFGAWSNIFLNKVGKGGPVEAFGVALSPRSKKLVTTGPYRFTRNPMVFGAFMMYLGISLFLNSIIDVICVILFLVMMMVFLKLSEEKRLQRDFGEEYTEYKKKVPMIFPFIHQA